MALSSGYPPPPPPSRSTPFRFGTLVNRRPLCFVETAPPLRVLFSLPLLRRSARSLKRLDVQAGDVSSRDQLVQNLVRRDTHAVERGCLQLPQQLVQDLAQSWLVLLPSSPVNVPSAGPHDDLTSPSDSFERRNGLGLGLTSPSTH